MTAFDRGSGWPQAGAPGTQEIKRLSRNITALGVEVRDIDRRVSRLEGVIVGQSQSGAGPRKRIP